jgi:hypothetical protein
VPRASFTTGGQVGDTDAEVIVDMTPGDRFTDILTTVFGLVRDGQVRHGMPRQLQLR